MTRRMLQRKGISEVIVLCGSVSKMFTNQAMAEKKWENFLLYTQLFPEYRYVFIGDSGQGGSFTMFCATLLIAVPICIALFALLVSLFHAYGSYKPNDGLDKALFKS